MFTYHQPVTFPGCSVLRTSLSVAVLCRSAASLPSSPPPAVTFTHLPNTHGGINGPETSNNLALTSSVLRFFASSPEEFQGRNGDVVPPACPASVSGSPPDGHDHEHLPRETRISSINLPPFLGAGTGLVRSGPDQVRHTVSNSVSQPLDLVGQLGLYCCGSRLFTSLVHCSDRRTIKKMYVPHEKCFTFKSKPHHQI